MLLFIILALLAKSLMPLAATEVDFDTTVVVAGLFSYIGLVSYIFLPQRTTGKSLDRSLRSVSIAEGPFETIDHPQLDIAAHSAGRAIAGSRLVRRLVRANDDPAKQRIRVQLGDERLFGFGLTSEDIAALRGTASSQAIITQALDAPSKDGSTRQIISPSSIAGVLGCNGP
jgi:hypothetical protein